MDERDGVYRRRGGSRRQRRTVIKHSDEEWARVQALAQLQGISAPRLYERALHAGDVVTAAKVTEVYGELVMLQRLIGNTAANINQVAKVANATGELPTAEQMQSAADLMQRQVDRIAELLRQIPGGDLYRSVSRDG